MCYSCAPSGGACVIFLCEGLFSGSPRPWRLWERRPSSRSESRSLCNTVILGLLTSSPADNSFPCFPYGVLQQIPNSVVDQMMNQL